MRANNPLLRPLAVARRRQLMLGAFGYLLTQLAQPWWCATSFRVSGRAFNPCGAFVGADTAVVGGRLRRGRLTSTIRDMNAGVGAAGVLLRARRSAAITQVELATLAATSQSAIAAYETGAREPSLAVLERIVGATGHRLVLTLEPDPALFRLADLAGQLRVAIEEQRRLRLVFEFLRSASEDGGPLLLLVAAEPSLTGDPRFDALLAAVAEHLCIGAGLDPPAWVHDPVRFLDGFWWVSDLPSARARALVHAPASFRRRGVMLDRHDLQAA